ncbi:IS3 family transposase [Flavobacterium endoglycinae]|uniref:IS3 family transposase n=1 Tax=Flavobacterium endoglycinae TaxID=2816357 RepID=A0ABX7QCU7_9FLAO|nr:IS3 family transposase [Flavobacterium endoglycinae]QSW88426.1 IS3 family transposase [Flavobacterium endoglycinae]
MKTKYKKFDRTFKDNAVTLSYEKSSLKQYAAELGILPCLLTRWRQEYQKFGEGRFPGSGYERVNPEKKKIVQLEKKSKESELLFEILKTASPCLNQGRLKIYQFLKRKRKKYPILLMCRTLDVPYSSYHRWEKNEISEKQLYLISLKKELATIFYAFKKNQGAAKIAEELSRRGYKIVRRQVSFYMRQLGLKRKKKRKFRVTTDSNHNHYTSPNFLNRKFNVKGHAEIWVSDITYLQTKKGFIYLTVIMDLYDRKIIGWNLGRRLSAQKTIIPAWEMAVNNRPISEGLIFHSDRGVQYANKCFAEKLDSHKCIQSMSRTGDHFDNAACESFFSSLKKELVYREKELLTVKKMKNEIFEFIENWYNQKRIHSSLQYKTIEQFNKQTACSQRDHT